MEKRNWSSEEKKIKAFLYTEPEWYAELRKQAVGHTTRVGCFECGYCGILADDEEEQFELPFEEKGKWVRIPDDTDEHYLNYLSVWST